jgi:hypothetical protein
MRARRGKHPSVISAGAALVILTLLAGCDLLPTGMVSGDPPTPSPTPTFREEARAICSTHAKAIRGLVAQLTPDVTDANLVDNGTAVAGLAGVVSTELLQLRSIPPEPLASDREAVSAWFDELGATADAQVRAVSASAARDVDGFRAAFEASVVHWDAAGTQAASIGLRGCHPVSLEPRS